MVDAAAENETTRLHMLKLKGAKVRADQLLFERGLVESRSRAQALILAGEVYVGEDTRVEKAGLQLRPDADLRIREQQKYVSRGGLKLEGALADCGCDPKGLTVADLGASTGGFTDCVLTRGALRVFAIDVGHGQLAEKLRQDARVTVMERKNARSLTKEEVSGGVDLVVVDASFISLDKLLPAIFEITKEGGHLLALIKPQFEVGRAEASKHAGVIRDPKVRAETILKVLTQVKSRGFSPLCDHPCRVAGPKGNVEHFVYAERLASAPLRSGVVG